MIKKVILVFKTHFDIGFTDTAERIIETYKGKMLEDVRNTCDATKDLGDRKYVWTMPSWPLYKMLELDCAVKSQNAEYVAELVRRGQLKWHALPFTSHFDFCGVEDYLRGYQISQKLAEEFQVPNPITAKMTDVPGHGMMLPSLLHTMGVKFLHLGTNDFATPPDVPQLFNWESPDGNQVLTMFSKASYGTSLEAPADWEYPVWMALLQTHDNCGPQSKELLESLIEKAKKKYPEAEIVTGTMDDFYNELIGYQPQVPTITSDLGDTWIHGVGTYPNEVSKVRAARGILTSVEKALNMLLVGNQERVPQQVHEQVQAEIDRAYFQLQLFSEHTWGLDVKTHMGDVRAYEKDEFKEFKNSDVAKKMEFSWDEQRQRAEQALQHAHNAEKILTGITQADDNRFLIFNPSGKKESIYVDVEQLREKLQGKVLNLKGKLCETEEIGQRLMLYAEDLEPLQFNRLMIEADAPKEDCYSVANQIENHRYRVECNPETGDITCIWDKKLNKNLVEPSQDTFAGYRYDRYGFGDINEYLRSYGYKFSDWGINDNTKMEYPDCEHETYRPTVSSVKVEGNSIRIEKTAGVSAKDYGDAQKTITEITLPRHGEEIFVTVELKNKQESLYGESGYISMPFAMKDAQIQINKTGCLLDIKKDIAKDANHVNYCIENSVVLSDATSAITVVSYDIPLLSVGDVGMFKFRSGYEDKGNNLFFNAFNNMWGTNFPQWLGGDFQFRFSICSHMKEEVQTEYYRSLSLAEKPLVMQGDLKDHTMEEVAFFSLPEYLRPSAIADSKGEMVLRVRDTSGANHGVKLAVPEYARDVRLINMNGEILCKGVGSELSFDTHPYGIYNIAWRWREKD